MNASHAPLEAPQQEHRQSLSRVPLFNGAIECRLFEFRMVAGSLRKPRPAGQLSQGHSHT